MSVQSVAIERRETPFLINQGLPSLPSLPLSLCVLVFIPHPSTPFFLSPSLFPRLQEERQRAEEVARIAAEKAAEEARKQAEEDARLAAIEAKRQAEAEQLRLRNERREAARRAREANDEDVIDDQQEAIAELEEHIA